MDSVSSEADVRIVERDPRPTLVFDDSCPMCKVYTGAFGALGWSERTACSTAIDDLATCSISTERATRSR